MCLITNNTQRCSAGVPSTLLLYGQQDLQSKGEEARTHTASESELSATHLLYTPHRAVSMALLFTTHAHKFVQYSALTFSPFLHVGGAMEGVMGASLGSGATICWGGGQDFQTGDLLCSCSKV